MSELERLITGLDLDGLVRLVDGCCASRDWDELLRIRDKCKLANDSGRQMWPITTLANFRLALHAPAEYAVCGLDERNPAFLFGPLSEVIAQNHSWSDLATFLGDDPVSDSIAHERAIRGDSVPAAGTFAAFDIPRELQPWEPKYSTATYSDSGVQHDPPLRPAHTERLAASNSFSPITDERVTSALRAVVEPWVSASNGRVEIVGAEDVASNALAALGVPSARITALEPSNALELLAWAGSSGGAHGRRRGLASGRYSAWWAATAIAGFDWPVDPDELGDAMSEIHWFQWDANEPDTGWHLRIIAEDPTDNVSWVLNAVDTAG